MPPLIIRTTGFEDFLDPSGGAYLKALIMGDHGVGKTPSAMNWPKPILADCEKGRLSVASMGVPYADIKTSLDMDALLEMLRHDCMKPAASRKYQTLVIDTVDTYQRKVIQERLKSERKESFSGWGDWGYLDGKMIQLIERVLNLPMNVVVNMHTKDVSDEDGDESRLVQKARLKGDFKDAIFQDFDLIGHMEQSYEADPEKKGERRRVRQIRWHSEPKYPSLRDRSNKLPRFTEVDFTAGDFQRIFDAITSGLDDLPPATDVETLEVEGDGAEPAPADVKGGPVEDPKVPAAKKAAAAKKTAAKKTTAPEPTPEPEAAGQPDGEERGVPAEDPWAPAADAETPVETPAVEAAPEAQAEPDAPDVEPDAEALVEAELGGVVVDTEQPEPDKAEPVETPKAAAKTAAKKATATTAAGTPVPKFCGEQPASMVGKFEPVQGCGQELNGQNASKHQIAMIKFRTYLCDEDYAKQQAVS